MLVNLNEVLRYAELNKCAVGSFNTPNTASIQAVIGAAEEQRLPVVIMHAQVHEEMGVCDLDDIAPLMLMYAKKATVPVCVHLDHGTDLDYVAKALKLGFTSVMYDGSALSEDENLKNTIAARVMSKMFGASLEAEIGSMGAREGAATAGPADTSIYTNPEDAKWFAEATGVDALACAFGTAHGVYLKKPQLDFPRLAKIHSLVNVPLVMHGGSGVSEEDYKKAIALGIRKINYYTYMTKAGGSAVAAMKDKSFYHDMENVAIEAMMKDATKAVRFFALKD